MNVLHQQNENNFLFPMKTPAHINSGRIKNIQCTNAAKLKRNKTLHKCYTQEKLEKYVGEKQNEGNLTEYKQKHISVSYK